MNAACEHACSRFCTAINQVILGAAREYCIPCTHTVLLSALLHEAIIRFIY